MNRWQLLSLFWLTACGTKTDKESSAPAPTPASAPTPAAAPNAPAPAPPADPYKLGSCEYTADGGAPQKGGGGVMNVGSIYWMPETQKGRSLAVPLLINCGPAGKQLNLSSVAEQAAVARGPKKYPVGSNQPFSVMGADFMGGEGEIDITAWDTAHVAGTFEVKGGGKIYKGSFDLKCPQPGNGICP